MFSEDEKKWILLEFARTASAAAVRRAFIAHFKIKGRVTVVNKHIIFTRNHDHFEKFRSVHNMKRKEIKTKRTEATINEV